MTPQPGPPINQPSVVISDALAKFIGTDGTFPQDDALKYLWDYIKANQLEVSPTVPPYLQSSHTNSSSFPYKPVLNFEI